MDPNWADLAKHVVDYLHPAVVVVGSGIGAGIGKEIGEKLVGKIGGLWGWLRGEYPRSIEKIEQMPEDSALWDDLADQVCRSLSKEADFHKALLAHLPEDLLAKLPTQFQQPSITQTVFSIGNGSINIQSGGNTTIS